MYDFEKHQTKTTTYIHKLNTFPTFKRTNVLVIKKLKKKLEKLKNSIIRYFSKKKVSRIHLWLT